MKECVNCKHGRGMGSDVWCGKGHTTYETYMQETNCPFYKRMNTELKKLTGKNHILDICHKLKDTGLISEIEEKKYSIKILIRCDDDSKDEEAYVIRDRIKNNFKKEGYNVDILGTWWLEIHFVNIRERIDNCFR